MPEELRHEDERVVGIISIGFILGFLIGLTGVGGGAHRRQAMLLRRMKRREMRPALRLQRRRRRNIMVWRYCIETLKIRPETQLAFSS